MDRAVAQAETACGPAPPAGSLEQSIEAVLEALAADGRLVHVERQAVRPGRTAPLARPLPASIGHCLPPGGLWSHQAAAVDLVRDGHSVVVATGTASGKSLCYQLPIAEAVVTGLRAGTSLLLYPTKALAQDQLRSFGQLAVPGLVAVAYDGDACREERSWARANANVVLTNPEMLHHGILPTHAKWATFLKRLEYVVIDELHVLRGIFGTHVAHVLRRLRRLCHRYGSDPTFVFCSATIGQPERLAADLCHKPVVAVTNDASPCGERHIAIVQPALLTSPHTANGGRDERDRGTARQSPATETVRTVAELVAHGHRVIAFCASRALTERVALGVARALPPELAGAVRPYRSGYLAAERREIEAELAAGALRAVVTTSALELGVDISGLDATVLCGFPGTIASLWQQIGRSGRTGRPSLAVLVAGDDQLDQWFVNHPDDLFARAPEPVVVNVENPNVRDPHLG
ncbi:MAG: DEAD/DEAH box helicase, partial [Acidimicrobiia bacterium]|nr:DEAD/DEAH box helicase [Acidimicrobiia bacterium]